MHVAACDGRKGCQLLNVWYWRLATACDLSCQCLCYCVATSNPLNAYGIALLLLASQCLCYRMAASISSMPLLWHCWFYLLHAFAIGLRCGIALRYIALRDTQHFAARLAPDSPLVSSWVRPTHRVSEAIRIRIGPVQNADTKSHARDHNKQSAARTSIDGTMAWWRWDDKCDSCGVRTHALADWRASALDHSAKLS